ncbi:MAG TPA: cysteine desulfurase family protein [Candidatus Paceibacterota bacterium]|nr:cysteine desulfurase family protein [Candidatus Paceibacterota bacterium]
MPKSTRNSKKYIYLDYAASVKANPSSVHDEGVKAKKQLQNARSVVAVILGARPEEIIFTSGGTESNNLAIQGVVFARRGRGLPHIITTNIEHPSVLETFQMLRDRKLAQISIVKIEANGIVDPKKIRKEIKKNTVLVSVHYANNEIGTIQPIKEIAKEIRHYKKSQKGLLPFFHTDAVQAANYLDLNVNQLGIDLLSISGSKIEGAGRVGVLYKKKSVSLTNIFGGGDQEMGLRPGTENLPEILKFSAALQLVQKIKDQEAKKLTKLRDYFFHKLNHSDILENTRIVVNGDLKNRLPNNINITIPNIPSELLVIELSALGIMASAKSACKAGDGKVSYVIKAINKNIKETDGSLRFSLGRQTNKKDIDYTIKALSEILTKLKKWYIPTPA